MYATLYNHIFRCSIGHWAPRGPVAFPQARPLANPLGLCWEPSRRCQ